MFAIVEAHETAERLRARGHRVVECPTTRVDRELRSAGEAVDVIVVGSRTSDPIQTAQRAYRFDSLVSVMLLADGQQCTRLREALRFAPFIGSDVACVEDGVEDHLDDIEKAARRTRARRNHRATVSALNFQLAKPPGAPPVPSRDVFAAQVLETAPVGILSLDGERRVIAANGEATRILGTTERELIGRPLEHAAVAGRDAGDHDDGWRALLEAARSQDAVATIELAKAGRTILDARAVSLVEGGGFLVVLNDVTERVRAAEEREAALRRAEDANRLKDEFLAVVSHELRTPLTAVLGWTRLLRTGAVDPARVAHALAVIERNAEAQARLVEDILDVSRIVTGKMQLDSRKICIADVLSQAVDGVRVAAAAKQVALTVHVASDLPDVHADADRLQQVLWNLLSNAVKFTPARGNVAVSATTHDALVEIRVSDDGAGIDPTMLPFIFDPFRQADSSSTRAHGGLGLGLAIVKRIIDLHGGTVTAASAGIGRGATFTISLPLLPRTEHSEPFASSGDKRSETRPRDGALAGVAVLVVDDERDARDLIAEVLDYAGATVTTADSVTDALRLVAEKSFDLIVSDVGMPNEDGYAFMHRYRELESKTSKRVPAVALTAYARERDRENALAAGFDAHVVKPIQPDTLLDVARRLLAKSASGRGTP